MGRSQGASAHVETHPEVLRPVHDMGGARHRERMDTRASVMDIDHSVHRGGDCLCLASLATEASMRILLFFSPLIVVSMLVALFLATWQPGVLAKHAEHKISNRWTRVVVGMTLVLVLTLVYMLPR